VEQQPTEWLESLLSWLFREDRSSVTDDSEVAIKVSATVIKVLATVACVALGAAVTMLCVQPAPATRKRTVALTHEVSWGCSSAALSAAEGYVILHPLVVSEHILECHKLGLCGFEESRSNNPHFLEPAPATRKPKVTLAHEVSQSIFWLLADW
jgi:hypothetical protein